MEKVVVIARAFQEIDWIEKLDCNVVIMNKGLPIDTRFKSKCLEEVMLENKWRGEGSYLEYIIRNYGNYPDVLAFTQDNPFPHCKDIIEKINSYSDDTLKPLGIVMKSDNQIYLKEILPLVFKSSPVYESELSFCAGNQYILPSKMLMKKSLDWWINAFEVFKDASNYLYDYFQENPDPIKVLPNHDAERLKSLGFETHKEWIDYNMPHIYERIMWKMYEYEE